jgi:hypothetical protein
MKKNRNPTKQKKRGDVAGDISRLMPIEPDINRKKMLLSKRV